MALQARMSKHRVDLSFRAVIFLVSLFVVASCSGPSAPGSKPSKAAPSDAASQPTSARAAPAPAPTQDDAPPGEGPAPRGPVKQARMDAGAAAQKSAQHQLCDEVLGRLAACFPDPRFEATLRHQWREFDGAGRDDTDSMVERLTEEVGTLDRARRTCENQAKAALRPPPSWHDRWSMKRLKELAAAGRDCTALATRLPPNVAFREL
jgi:hypothetical protein